METRGVEAIVRALNDANVRYLVAGGLAVVAHGYVRFTADVDLILDLDAQNVRRAVTALGRLSYRLEEFAEPAKRAEWVREKGLTVFSLFSANHAATEVDLFVELPIDFERAYAAAARLEVAPDVVATFIGIADLIRLKRDAGRPQDLIDIDKLQSLHKETWRD